MGNAECKNASAVEHRTPTGIGVSVQGDTSRLGKVPASPLVNLAAPRTESQDRCTDRCRQQTEPSAAPQSSDRHFPACALRVIERPKRRSPPQLFHLSPCTSKCIHRIVYATMPPRVLQKSAPRDCCQLRFCDDFGDFPAHEVFQPASFPLVPVVLARPSCALYLTFPPHCSRPPALPFSGHRTNTFLATSSPSSEEDLRRPCRSTSIL